jgi:hypothetical protein
MPSFQSLTPMSPCQMHGTGIKSILLLLYYFRRHIGSPSEPHLVLCLLLVYIQNRSTHSRHVSGRCYISLSWTVLYLTIVHSGPVFSQPHFHLSIPGRPRQPHRPTRRAQSKFLQLDFLMHKIPCINLSVCSSLCHLLSGLVQSTVFSLSCFPSPLLRSLGLGLPFTVQHSSRQRTWLVWHLSYALFRQEIQVPFVTVRFGSVISLCFCCDHFTTCGLEWLVPRPCFITVLEDGWMSDDHGGLEWLVLRPCFIMRR